MALRASASVSAKGSVAFRLDEALAPGVGDHGGGAVGAFAGVEVGAELDMGAAARAGDAADVDRLGLGEVGREGGAEVELADGAPRGAGAVDGLGVAAVVADEVARRRVEPEVRAAGVAGEAVVGVGRRVHGAARGGVSRAL